MARHSIDKDFLYGLYFAAVTFMVGGTVIFGDDHAFFYGLGVGAATGFVHLLGDSK